MGNELDLRDLRSSINAIFDHIENDLNIRKIELEENFYWEIDAVPMFDMGSKPSLDSVGSLLDDWEFLLSVATERDQAVALMLTHAAPLLRYIGEKIRR